MRVLVPLPLDKGEGKKGEGIRIANKNLRG